MAHTVRLREWLEALLTHCPSDCPLCGVRAAAGGLCIECQAELNRTFLASGARCERCALALDVHGVCHDCQALRPDFDRVIVAFDYVFPGTLLVHQLKRQHRFVLARMLAALLARRIRDSAMTVHSDTILLPVPASRSSLHERGFSPPAELAHHLSRALGLPCRTDILYRRHESGQQKRMDRHQRLVAASQLYACAQRLDGQAVALVDDVMTTGATLHSVSRVLKQAGASSVSAFVLARTPLRARIV